MRPVPAFWQALSVFLLLPGVLWSAVPASASSRPWPARAWQAETPTPAPAATLAAATATPAVTATPVPAAGQQALITAVDADRFPDISAYLLVSDAAGARVSGLAASNFELAENDQPVAGLEAGEQDVGVQVVFALDSNEAFKARDAAGVTRLQFVQRALAAFAQGTPGMTGGADDVTVLAAEGVVVEHNNNPPLVAQAVERYASTFGGAADPFPLLNRALDYALDIGPRPGMRRFLIYISNGISRPDITGSLADITARASAGPVFIYTVYVGPQGSEESVAAQNLQRLAAANGGRRLIFDRPQSLEPLFQLLSEQGQQYRLSYRSGLATTGQHSLAARVSLPDGRTLASNAPLFPLRVEPPRVELVDVPATLVRTVAARGADPAQAEPAAYEVQVRVDFPDGHPRGLRAAELWVDGQKAAASGQAGEVQSLTWPLTGYTSNAEHQLMALVVDELGLAAQSAPVAVSLSLQAPAAPASTAIAPAQVFRPGGPLLAVALAAIGLALAVGLVAWLASTQRPRAEAVGVETLPPGAAAAQSTARAPAPPKAPPVRVKAASSGSASRPHVLLPHVSVPGFRWPGRGAPPAPRGVGYLEVLVPGAGDGRRPNIPVVGGQFTFGRDAEVADTIFHDRSVARLHARLTVEGDQVRLFDQGSPSGTWVNYAPIAADEGCELKHGDLINLGRVQLRFKRHALPSHKGNGARVAQAPGRVPPAPPAPAAPEPTPASDEAVS